jgi:hypothetical protein
MRAACAAAAVTVSLLGSFCATAAGAEEAMSLRYYKRAKVQGGDLAAEAERYVDGTLHGMLLLSDVLRRDGRPVFCAGAAEAQGDGLELGRLGAGFRGWLDDAPVSGSDDPAVQEAPIAMFALTYLGTALPCADEAAGEPGGGDLGSVLRRALSE